MIIDLIREKKNLIHTNYLINFKDYSNYLNIYEKEALEKNNKFLNNIYSVKKGFNFLINRFEGRIFILINGITESLLKKIKILGENLIFIENISVEISNDLINWEEIFSGNIEDLKEKEFNNRFKFLKINLNNILEECKINDLNILIDENFSIKDYKKISFFKKKINTGKYRLNNENIVFNLLDSFFEILDYEDNSNIIYPKDVYFKFEEYFYDEKIYIRKDIKIKNKNIFEIDNINYDIFYLNSQFKLIKYSNSQEDDVFEKTNFYLCCLRINNFILTQMIVINPILINYSIEEILNGIMIRII